jgi:triacylglycerol lipase
MGEEISNTVAAAWGLTVMCAMDMYRVNVNDLTPEPAALLKKSGWETRAYIIGKDHLPFKKGPLLIAQNEVCYGYVAERNGTWAAVIRGTDGLIEWIEDAEFLPALYSPQIKLPPGPPNAKVEQGFWSIYDTMQLTKLSGERLGDLAGEIAKLVPAGSKITVVGHSLGAALATYLALDLARGVLGERVSACLFASPHPGNQDFALYFDKTVANYRLLNYALDVVPRVPLGPDYAPLPKRTVIQPTTAEASIKLDVGCNHHVICYCAMLDYEETKSATTPVPAGEESSATCIVGPEVGRPSLAKLLLSAVGGMVPV